MGGRGHGRRWRLVAAAISSKRGDRDSSWILGGQHSRGCRLCEPGDIDAVLISHSHPDHCADLLPLLRARALSEPAAEPLPIYAPAGALDTLLASDAVAAVQRGADVRVVTDGSSLWIGAFEATFAELPHHVTNLGMRLTAGEVTISYTGDGGPDAAVVELAPDADLHIAEATFVGPVTGEDAGLLTGLATAVEQGAAAGARQVLLTHLWPGTSYDQIIEARYPGSTPLVGVARAGMTWQSPA